MTDPRQRSLGLLALVLVQLCFGLFPVFGKWAFEGGTFSPAAVATWRIVAGAVLLGLLALVLCGRRVIPARRDLPRLFACALFGVMLNQGLFLEGLSRSEAVNSGLIMCLIPVLTYIVAVLFGAEPLGLRRTLGIGVALLGTAGLFVGRGDELVGPHALGNLLMVLNATSYALYLVLSKPLTLRYPPLVIIAWVYVLSLTSLPYFAPGETLVPGFAGAERAWWSLLFIVAFPTVLGYLLNVFALARVRASTTAFFIYLQPLITGGGGVLLLGESLRGDLFVSALLIGFGMWLVIRRGPG